MKRPLAVFGFVYLFAMLAATQIPLAAYLPCALLAAVVFSVTLFLYKRRKVALAVPVVLAAVWLALAVFTGYHQWRVKPVQVLVGNQYSVTARVTEAATSTGGDTMDVTLEIIEGLPVGKGVKVTLIAFPEVEIGDVVEADLHFYALNSKTSSASFAKGRFVGARLRGTPAVTGRSINWVCALRLLQYSASEHIRSLLPGRLSSVAAAMAVGDSRFLTPQTKAAYRAAGLTHTLVVSGMHLSVLCGAMYAAFWSILRRKRAASALCIGLVLLFMAFTGFTPSIVRSGVVYLLVYAAALFRRKADVYTSLGVAAFLLSTQNPFASADIGLLLSFAATFGVLMANKTEGRLRASWAQKPVGMPKRLLCRVLLLLVAPVYVSVATLPVLLAFGLGVAPLSLPMNILALPLLTPVVLIGLLLGALGGIAPLVWLLKPLVALAGFALVLLEWLTEFCLRFQFSTLFIGGALAVALLLLYPLGFLAIKTKRYKAFTAAGLVLVLTGGLLHFGLQAGTVQVTMAGSGSNPSLVVTRGRECVIIYRDRRTAWAIEQVIQQRGAPDCVLFVDLRKTSQSTEYLAMFRPQQVVVVGVEVVNRAEYNPLENTSILLQKQGEGMLACVDIAGYRVGLTSGAVNVGLYAPLDVFVAGSGETKGLHGQVLVNGVWPDWLEEQQSLLPVLTSTGQTTLVVRPRKSVMIKEAGDHDANR